MVACHFVCCVSPLQSESDEDSNEIIDITPREVTSDSFTTPKPKTIPSTRKSQTSSVDATEEMRMRKEQSERKDERIKSAHVGINSFMLHLFVLHFFFAITDDEYWSLAVLVDFLVDSGGIKLELVDSVDGSVKIESSRHGNRREFSKQYDEYCHSSDYQQSVFDTDESSHEGEGVAVEASILHRRVESVHSYSRSNGARKERIGGRVAGREHRIVGR